jgi:agmatine/peptidylarginine deiminase
MPINDTWARDHAGITVIENGRKVIYDFCFNGWGMKFPANHDNKITRHLFENKAFTNDYTYKKCLNFVLEGGSIESDGAGTLLTTAQCLTADNRNYLSESELDEKLKNFFGLKQILWLHHGYLAGDDTDSHIDTLARLIPNNAIAYIKCENPEDEHYKALKLMENELKNFRTTDGKPYKLVALPMADAVLDKAGNKLPATYANFLIINSAVLVPTYNSPKDEIACDILQNVFKERKIVPVNCLPLIKQHGSLHCVTMQFPK